MWVEEYTHDVSPPKIKMLRGPWHRTGDQKVTGSIPVWDSEVFLRAWACVLTFLISCGKRLCSLITGGVLMGWLYNMPNSITCTYVMGIFKGRISWHLLRPPVIMRGRYDEKGFSWVINSCSSSFRISIYRFLVNRTSLSLGTFLFRSIMQSCTCFRNLRLVDIALLTLMIKSCSQ